MKKFFLLVVMLVSLASTAQNIVRVYKVEDVRVTYFTACKEECGNDRGQTASGVMVHDGVIACNFLPKNTKVRIPSLYGRKVFTVYDKLAEGLINNIDIYVKHKKLIPKEGHFEVYIEVIG